MGNSVRDRTSGRGKASEISHPTHDNAHDGIELELLELWLGLSRLREKIRTGCVRRARRFVAMTRKRPAARKPRRSAA